jgi:hypothetical protein
VTGPAGAPGGAQRVPLPAFSLRSKRSTRRCAPVPRRFAPGLGLRAPLAGRGESLCPLWLQVALRGRFPRSSRGARTGRRHPLPRQFGQRRPSPAPAPPFTSRPSGTARVRARLCVARASSRG